MNDTINKIEAKFIPFKCPVCNGFKTVSYQKITCTSCNGKGFILINQNTGEVHNGKQKSTT